MGVVGIAAIGSSCNLDPVHRAAVKNLGPERDDLYPVESEYHRPGEPCALCHSKDGPAKSEFLLGGTIFWWDDPNDGDKNLSYNDRVDRAYVRIKDSRQVTKCFVTNCNGNFFVRPEQWQPYGPEFPVLVSVERTVNPGVDETRLLYRAMSGHIGREASCANCHIQGIRDYGSPDQIRLFESQQQFKDAKIQVAPCPPPEDAPPPLIQCPEDREAP